MVMKKIRLNSFNNTVSVLGIQDSKLRLLEKELKVEIFVRHDPDSEGVELTIKGSISRVDKALEVINRLVAEPRADHVKAKTERPKQDPVIDGVLYLPYHGKPLKARSAHQAEYIDLIFKHDVVFGIGPAGTGKTYLAVAAALRALELEFIDRIILTRPIVEAGEKLGFLPGDLHEKVNPYLRPLYDCFIALLGPDHFKNYMDNGIIEILPLAYMRGRTLDRAFIILDEAQNTVPEQMKMFLTRMGFNSKVLVTGDLTQIDLSDKNQSGLLNAKNVLMHTPGVVFQTFTREDIVRHELVKEIVLAYENWENKKSLKQNRFS